MKTAKELARLLIIPACWLAMTDHLLAQHEIAPRLSLSAIRCDERADQRLQKASSDGRFYQNSKGRAYVQFSAGPAMVSPSGPFYEGLSSHVGFQIGVRLYETNNNGQAQGFCGGMSFYRARLDQRTDSSYPYQPVLVAGSVLASAFALEGGRVIPADNKGSYLYLMMGLAALRHKGSVSEVDASILGYQAGSRFAIRLKGGFALALSNHLGLDFGFDLDVMPTRVTYTDLGNYTETKISGYLTSAGAGLVYRL